MVTNRPLIWWVFGVMCSRTSPSVGFTSPGYSGTRMQGAGDSFYSSERRLASPTDHASGICGRLSYSLCASRTSIVTLEKHTPSRPQSRRRARMSVKAPETVIGLKQARRTRHCRGHAQRSGEPRARRSEGQLNGDGSLAEATLAADGARARLPRGKGGAVNFYINNLKQYQLLDAGEELVMGREVQRGVRCELARDRLEAQRGSAPTHDEWAAALGLATPELLADLRAAKRAKRAMISANLRLVVSIAKRYRYKGVAFPDLIQEGTLGLVKASEKFNPELGFKFSTYATWWIKQSIVIGIGEQSRVIRLPVHVQSFLDSVQRSSMKMAANGHLPTDNEIGEDLQTSAQKIQFYRKAAATTCSLSLDARIRGNLRVGENPNAELSDVVVEGDSPEGLSHTSDLRRKVMTLLETLDYREQKVVRARYGLDGLSPRTLKEIGREFDITRERVRQIESKAMNKLRQPYRNYRLRDHAGQLAGVEVLPQPAQEAVVAAATMIAVKESTNNARSRRGGSGGIDGVVPYSYPRLGAVSEEKPAQAAEKHSLEIESKRRLLDKAWNQESEAMLHQLECELARCEQESLILAL